MSDSFNLFASVFAGALGFGYFIYGKKQRNPVAFFSGIGLMVYPYFVGNHWAVVGIGIALAALPFLISL